MNLGVLASPRVDNSAVGKTLKVESVSKRFGGLRVFEAISLELKPGDILGVIGPNGAGKTTLINVICGMIPPSAGRIMLGDQDVTAKPFHTLSQLGVVRSFQQTNTFRDVSVEENLYRAKRFSASRAGPPLQLDELLDEFGLSGHLHEPSDKLPYGLQKMLGLIMVLTTRPQIILLDEPAAGLERRERTRGRPLYRTCAGCARMRHTGGGARYGPRPTSLPEYPGSRGRSAIGRRPPGRSALSP